MSLSKEEIERLHKSGKMPDFYYYQVNGKNIQENFAEIYRNRQAEIQEYLEEKRIDEIVQEEIDKRIPDVLDKAIRDVFKNFGK